MTVDWDRPSFERRGGLVLESAAQIGVAHERTTQTESAPLRWTSTPPNREGFWWNRHRDRPLSAVPVYVFGDGFAFYMLDPSGKARVDVRARWQDLWSTSPIPEPEDA